MADRTVYSSPQLYARLGGALYLIIIVFGLFSEGVVNSKLIVSGDIAATAHNIIASQDLYRASIAGNVFVPLCAVALLMIEYVLLRPVSRELVLLAVFFNLVSLAVEAVSKVYLLDALSLLQGSKAASAFAPDQLQSLAYFSLKLHDFAWNIALIFFGCTCLVNGYLIFRSSYFPKAVGLLLQLAGACYLVACWAALFAPAFADIVLPGILLPALVGELSFCLWLLIKGVNVAKWRAYNKLPAAGVTSA